jgi:hypothetical protein
MGFVFTRSINGLAVRSPAAASFTNPNRKADQTANRKPPAHKANEPSIKAKTLNNVVRFEDTVSRSGSKHEGESSSGNFRQALAGLAALVRGSSRRIHDYAVSTCKYQLDQSSPLPATAAADLVLDRKKTTSAP